MAASNDILFRVVAKDESSAAFQSLAKNVDSVEKSIASLKSTMSSASTTDWAKSLANQAISAQNSVDKVATSISRNTGTATQNLQNMGRIIQDIPYGIMGIGNNIQPMVESFARAKAEAGSTGAAVKLLIGELAGPAGLAMVGIPIVTSLAIAFGPALIKAINSGTKGVEELKTELQGIQQYSNIALSIKIAGAEGLAKLKLELQNLVERKAYLEGAASYDAMVKRTGSPMAPGFMNPLGYGLLISKQREANNAATASQEAFYRGTASKIYNNQLDLGEAENVRLLTTYLKMSEESARTRLAINKVNTDVSIKNSQINLQAEKDSQKAANASASATKKAINVSESFATVYNDSRKLVNDLDGRQSAYNKTIGEYENTLIKISELEAKRKKFSKGGSAEENDQAVANLQRARELAIANRDRALLKGTGGSREVMASLDEDLALLKLYNEQKLISDQEYEDRRMAAILQANKKAIELDNSMVGMMKQAALKLSDSWTSALNDMVWGAKISFGQILESFGKMVTQMIIQRSFVDPLLSMILPTTNSANGNVFIGGHVQPFAAGGIVTGPTFFPMANGGVGLMGEAGAEAVMPLTRTSSGKLGVRSEGGGQQNVKVEIINQSGQDLKVTSAAPSYDADGMVLGIVIDGIQRNKMGLRDLLTQR
jgi:phage-related minor tail protein